MSTIITIKGIEESIFNLQYRNKSALKYQLIHAVRDFYTDEQSIETLDEINGDELIRRLWPKIDDPAAVRNKRKNLNSVKSTINADLRKLFQEGKNEEGIIIGPNNVFIMSEEAKEAAFAVFRSTMEKTGSVDLGKMLEVLSIVNDSLSDVEGIIEKQGTSAAEKMNELKSLIRGLAGKVNLERFIAERPPGERREVRGPEEPARREEPPPEPSATKTRPPAPQTTEFPDGPDEANDFAMTGEVFEEALDREEMLPDTETESAELSGDELAQLDEMALEEQAVDPQAFDERVIIEEEPEWNESERTEAPEPAEIVDEPAAATESALPADEFDSWIGEEPLTEELIVAEEEPLEETDAGTEETVMEPAVPEEREELIEETDAAEEAPPESAAEEVVDDAVFFEEADEDDQDAVAVEKEPEADAEIVLNENPAEVEDSEALSADISISEETDAVSLPEEEELAEDLESGADAPVAEESTEAEDLEAVETPPEPEELMEEAAEGVEELDLDENPAIDTLAETDPESPETGELDEPDPVEELSIPESVDLLDDILTTGEEQNLSVDETEAVDVLIDETETVVEEEAESAAEAEAADVLAEPVDEEELTEEAAVVAEPAAEVADESGESAEPELETVEPGADEILEEVEAEAEPETAEEIQEDELLETDTVAEEISADATAPTTPPPVLPEGLLGFDEADRNTYAERARFLAETFNDSLAAMDKFYNQYVLIPGGRYVIGNHGSRDKSKTENTKDLPAFYMGKFPVTNALFEIFIEKTGYKTLAEKKGCGLVYYPRCRQIKNERSGLNTYSYRSALLSEIVRDACWYQPSGPGSTLYRKRNHPVVQVSLEDALAFAAWTGKRLPHEDEWEAAARGVKGLFYPWGARWQKGACNVEESDRGDTAPVEYYREFENEFGLADMLGNVLQWTLDSFEENNPQYYIVKGGSWISKSGVRLTERLKLDKETCSNILGFRCVAY